jgi:hypothetical protein
MEAVMKLLLSLLLVCASLYAEKPKGTGWIPLIGAGLQGWKDYGQLGNAWTVNKGELSNGSKGRTNNIHTERKHGDVELYVEFMIPKGSNSGVYLQGLYEVQIFDSFGTAKPTTSDGGAIYHRWINEKPVGGSAPKVNAQKAPGEWQSYQVWFRAPRFDASGKKTENAKFIKVIHNGQIVQENVEVDGGTRAHMDLKESAENPIMLQGDHGPVTFRDLYIRPLK